MTNDKLARLMGQVVVVHATLSRVRDERQFTWEPSRLEAPRPGWVVGYRWLQNGERIPGCGGHGLEDDYDPPYFHEKGPRTPCLLVAFWPTMKPVNVPLESYRRAQANEKPYLKKQVWTDADRRYASENTENAPRDERGRFLK